jgi:hypothetical protein
MRSGSVTVRAEGNKVAVTYVLHADGQDLFALLRPTAIFSLRFGEAIAP